MIKTTSIKIFETDYKKIKEISKLQDDKNYIKVLSRAINNLHKITVLNRLPKKD